ncbi:SbcC/MukB-like Walker B domain-containing protein [Roseivirga sp. BDSF3-8]|uniref:SbcC/MukB-like Walker B domain-containing protein n=1 Tax=Roseivirga sp. BDSF3-8 TaxID=3241598 RepID=UPI0035320B4A
MIPVTLTIEGLYSYRERQTIDFETLTSGQLFGIFGGVGSGKSSILEAIMFVLYDRSPRLSARGDNRYYNMLNLQSDSLYIDFTFKAGKQNESLYRFTFTAQRKKSDYDTVEVKERGYYIDKGGDWQPLPDKLDTAEVVGMSYEHFMQTIIIPQGKFREFIDQPARDRTKMLQELFRLDKFDLGEPANKLVSGTKEDLLVLNTQLEGLGEVSEEQLAEGQQAIAEMKEKLLDGQKETVDLQAQQKECERLKGLYDSLKAYRNELTILQGQQDSYQQRRSSLARYELAVVEFRDKLESYGQLQQDLIEQKEQVTNLIQSLERQKGALAEAEKDYEEAEKGLANREQLRQQLEDLELIIDIGEESRKEKGLSEKLKAQDAACEKIRHDLEEGKTRLGKTREQQAGLEDMPDREGEIITALNARRDIRRHQERTTKLKETVAAERLQLEKQQGELQELLKSSGLEADSSLATEAIEEQIAERLRDAEKEQATLAEEKNRLQVKHRLSEWANDLKEGDPCPLCGATHHPDVAGFEAVHSQLKVLSKKEAAEKDKARVWTDLKVQVSRIAATLEGAQQNVQSRERELAEHESQPLPEVAPDYAEATEETLQQSLEAAKAARQHRSKLAKQREEQEATVEKLRTLAETQERARQETQSEQRIAAAAVADKKQRVKVLPVEKFMEKPVEELRRSAERGRRKIADLEATYEQKKKAAEEAKQAYVQTEATLKSREEQKNLTAKRAEDRTAELNALATQHNFDSLQDIKALLKKGLDIATEKDALAAYDKKLHSLGEQVKKCESDIDGQAYEAERHETLNRRLDELRETTGNLEKQLAVAEKERQRMLEQMEKKKDLLEKKEALEVRLGNLNEIAYLFRGSGFVRYVSSIRLRDLCRAANERFFKLTKNNLSLELNEQNDFIVRDYLNNGRTRLLKTLSGGQTFQAALCLALALAENIRSLNEADQSFFFLDEGFGSLDKDSLRIVFETLKSLRKENRIVGIISHVEELQQEIDLYLKIENDKERGSMIGYSWKGD